MSSTPPPAARVDTVATMLAPHVPRRGRMRHETKANLTAFADFPPAVDMDFPWPPCCTWRWQPAAGILVGDAGHRWVRRCFAAGLPWLAAALIGGSGDGSQVGACCRQRSRSVGGPECAIPRSDHHRCGYFCLARAGARKHLWPVANELRFTQGARPIA